MTLSKKYTEIMDKIVLSDDARNKIHKTIKEYNGDSKVVSFTNWKKYTAVAAALAVLVVGGSVIHMQSTTKSTDGSTILLENPSDRDTTGTYNLESSKKEDAMLDETAPEEIAEGEMDSSTTIANPITEYANIGELSKAIGFDMEELNNLPFQPKSTFYATVAGDLAEIIYYGNNDSEEICYRKALGSEDISGDYNNYTVETTTEINGHTVTLKGYEAGLYNLALWSDGTYSYSLSLSPARAPEQLEAMLK